MARDYKEYYKVAREYMEEHPACEVHLKEGWGLVASAEIHHISGRRGPLLTDKENFLACCSECHRLIHWGANEGYGPKWARERNYLK